MVHYKGSYGHGMKQYTHNNLVKFAFEIWMATDSKSKYLYNFQVYTDTNVKKNLCGAKASEANTNYEIVMYLMRNLYGLGHVVVMDDFFTSPRLSVDLFEKGTMRTNTT